jgi:hypothetical protein
MNVLLSFVYPGCVERVGVFADRTAAESFAAHNRPAGCTVSFTDLTDEVAA